MKSSWNETFALDETSFEKSVFPNLINGPRDLLLICNSAGKNNKKITGEVIEKSLDGIQRRKWGDLATQYNSQWPKIDSLAKSIVELIIKKHGRGPITKRLFNSTIQEQFSKPKTPIHDLRKQVSWINTALWANPSIEERLFITGCLGYVSGGEMYYAWNGSSLEKFRLADKIFISPIFTRGISKSTTP